MIARAIKSVLLATAVLLPAATGWIVRGLRATTGQPREPVLFEVETGWSARNVIAHLGRAGLAADPLALRLAHRAFFADRSFKAGEYLFAPPLPPKDVLMRILAGRVHLASVVVPEGLTGDEVAALLRPGDPAGAAAFRRAFEATELIADWDPEARDLEGYLFPDTYSLPRKATEEETVEAMVAGFRAVFDGDRRRRAAELGLSVREAVTLASLIEEETALPEERPLVSAVFHNRLKIGMKLDCDPTVAYALKRAGRYAGRLLLKDLKFESPYNTYLHPGLPPGPIANPGRASLDAALHPASEPYLYFVATGDGGHRFSRTLGEHLDAVRQFRALKKR
ncbi:MAG TPA: endolytic transglycosylase MltG [Candidatus Aminicenantes bacterium]|nr:endolytic transglycosylase MltG [Candidatus Aminicenantes bacterium]